MQIKRNLSDEQVENLTNFYLDKRDFMTRPEQWICERVIQNRKMDVEESYIITQLHKNLENLE